MDALTAHKGQGLTLSMTFLGLDDIFGFGLAYTMYTRSRYAENMCNVGVPPNDILEALLRRDSNGQDAIDRKRVQVQTLLKDKNAFDAMMDARIESGEFCLKTIATDLALATEPVLAQARAKLREVQGTLYYITNKAMTKNIYKRSYDIFYATRSVEQPANNPGASWGPIWTPPFVSAHGIQFKLFFYSQQSPLLDTC